MNIVFDGVSAFDPHQRGQLFLLVGALDVVDGEGHHHAVRMAGRLFIYRIDHVEGGLGEVPTSGFGIGPDGKKLRAQIAGTGLVQADVADVFGIGGADIEVLVEKTLRCVGVSVNDDGGVVDGASSGADGLRGKE